VHDGGAGRVDVADVGGMWCERYDLEHAVVGNGERPCCCWADLSGRTARSAVSTRAGISDRAGEDQSRSCRFVYAHRRGWPLPSPTSRRGVHAGCRHTEAVATLLTGQHNCDRQPHDQRSHLLRHRNPLSGQPAQDRRAGGNKVTALHLRGNPTPPTSRLVAKTFIRGAEPMWPKEA
jgi:hypothetical protein